MKRESLSSANLASVGYDEALQSLEIEFRNGHIYAYFDVPADVYQGLLDAGSPGSFFVSTIRDRYRYQLLKW
jgi:hypothetical protein